MTEMGLNLFRGRRFASRISTGLLVVATMALLAATLSAQPSTNYTGNGGKHTIQGRIYRVDGRRAEFTGIKVRLIIRSAGDLTTYADANGFFAFKNLTSGSYTVSVEENDGFENYQENVYIDDIGSSSMSTTPVRITPPTRVMNVQVYLKPSPTVAERPARVISAKWAGIAKAAREHHERGNRLALAGKTAEAEAEYRKALAIEPGFGPVYTDLGLLQQKAGQLPAAIESWLTALKYDENDFDAHLNLGIAYLNLKRYPECETELVSAAFIDRTAITPHYYLGMLYVVKNDLAVARKAFETARDLRGGKTMPDVHKVLGRVYMAMKLDKDAIRELEAYLELVPGARDAERVRKDISEIKSRAN
jgi:tetratricopeptide (TPR) repeat protein